MVSKERGTIVTHARLPKLTYRSILFVGFFVSAGILGLYQMRMPKAELILKDEQLRVLIAEIPKHQYKGLGGRESLGAYDGMFFVYPEKSACQVVMRDMKFPIDVIWFYDGKVVDFAHDLALERPGTPEQDLRVYRPRVPCDRFLEVPAGWTKAHDLKVGDLLSHAKRL